MDWPFNQTAHMIQKFIFLCCVLCFLSGCIHQKNPAPVVNAWYQSSATHAAYRVRSGDTIYSIAWAFGLDYHALAAVNHIKSPYAISVGQSLKMTNIARGHAYHGEIQTYKVRHAEIVPSYPSLHWHWPAKGSVIKGYNQNAFDHQGLSITGKVGEPIVASAAGEVVYSGDGIRGYGNLIIIKHNTHMLSAYAFNRKILVHVGERVHAGSIIATMGTNENNQPMLYFEIRKNGIPINPRLFLH